MEKRKPIFYLYYTGRHLIQRLRDAVLKLPLMTLAQIDDLQPKEKISAAYIQRIRHDIDEILNDDVPRTAIMKLREYLNSLWPKIQGSSISYTAIPNTEVVRVLFELAVIICEFYNCFKEEGPFLTPLEVLMPDLAFTSYHLHFPPLESMPVTWTEEKAMSLDSLLKRKFQLQADSLTEAETDELFSLKNEIKGLKDDLRKTVVNDGVTRAQENRYEKQEDEANKKAMTPYEIGLKLDACDTRLKMLEQKAANQALLNQLAFLEVERAEYRCAEATCDVKENYFIPKPKILWKALCQSIAIQRENTTILVPVSVLLMDEKNLILPYGADRVQALTEEEMQRLTNHSGETIALMEARKERDRYANDPQHLLGQLNLFCQALKQNDSHEGFGTDRVAGVGAYRAIIVFAEYYRYLDERQMAAIPLPIKNEIDYFLSLAADPHVNHDANGRLDTCIGRRRETLEELIPQHRLALSEITCEAETFAVLIESADKRVKEAEKNLALSLKKNTYCESEQQEAYTGCDKLGLTSSMLAFLAFKLTFERSAEVHGLMTLEKEGMQQLVQGADNVNNIVAHFDNVDTLTDFMHIYPSRQLDALFSIVGEPLFQKLSTSMQEVKALLISLPAAKLRVVYGILEKAARFEWEPMKILNLFYDNLEKTEVILSFMSKDPTIAIPKEKDDEDRTLLHRAASANATVCLRLLELYPQCMRPDVLMRGDGDGHTVLHHLAREPEIFIETLKVHFQGCEFRRVLETQNHQGDSVFSMVATQPVVLRWLTTVLSNDGIKSLITIRNRSYFGALHKAMSDMEALTILLECLADELWVLSCTRYEDLFVYRSFLHYAASNAKALALTLALYPAEQRIVALKSIGKLGPGDNEKQTVFQEALKYEASITALISLLTPEVFTDALLEGDADNQHLIDETFLTPAIFTWIILKLPEADVRRLITHQNEKGETILHRAAAHVEILKAVSKFFTQDELRQLILVETTDGDTVLHRSCHRKSFFFLWGAFSSKQQYALLGQQNKQGNTILHAVCRQKDIVHQLWVRLPTEAWVKLLKIPNADQNTVTHLLAHHKDLWTFVLGALSVRERVELLDRRNSSGNTVWHCMSDPETLLSLLQKVSAQDRFRIINARNVSNETLLHCWWDGKFDTFDIVYRLIMLIPIKDRLKAILTQNSQGVFILKEIMHVYGASVIPTLKTLLEILPQEDRMRVLTERLNNYSVLDKIRFWPESIPAILECLNDGKAKVDFLTKTDSLDYPRIELFCAHHAPELMTKILERVPSEYRLEVVLKRDGGMQPDFFYIENPALMRALLQLLTVSQQLDAVRIKDDLNRSLLYRMRDNVKMLEAILTTLPHMYRLEPLMDFAPASHRSILEVIAKEHYHDILPKVLLLLAHKDSLGRDLQLLDFMKTKMNHPDDQMLAKAFYKACIMSFKESIFQSIHPVGCFFIPRASQSCSKNEAINKILVAIETDTDAKLEQSEKLVIEGTPLLKRCIQDYEARKGLCLLGKSGLNGNRPIYAPLPIERGAIRRFY